METIALNGSTGFLGSKIIENLKSKYNIIRINRDHYYLPPNELANIIEGATYVINMAGAPIDKLWTNKYAETIYNSRILTTRNLVSSIGFMNTKPKMFISFSGINIYRSGLQHNEQSIRYADSFLAKVCMDWEKEALICNSYCIPTSIIRLGIVLSWEGGFLQKLALTKKFKVLALFANDDEKLSFMHIDDFLDALFFLIHNNLNGIFNFVAPESCNYLEFSRSFSNYHALWKTFKVPDILLQLLPNKMNELFTQGQDVIPESLIKKGYKFRYSNIQSIFNTSLH